MVLRVTKDGLGYGRSREGNKYSTSTNGDPQILVDGGG